MIEKIAQGIVIAIIDWFFYTNLYGWGIYLIKSLEALEFLDTPYWVILSAGTIMYILGEFIYYKVKEIKEVINIK